MLKTNMTTPTINTPPTGDDALQANKRRRSNEDPNTPFASPIGSRTDLTTTPAIILTDNCLVYYKTLRKLQRGILKSRHHCTLLSTHIDRGTTPKGLQANVTSQIPEISTEFQLQWERIYLDFSTKLTNSLLDYWKNRLEDLESKKTKLIKEATQLCTTVQIEEVTSLLDLIQLNPVETQKSTRKVGASRSRQNLQVPTQPLTSAQRR